MRKINNAIIILLIITCYALGIYNLKHQLIVRFLIDILVLPIVFFPKIISKKIMDVDSKLEFVYLLFIFFAYYLGTVINFYDKFYFYDTLMHFLSGVFEAYIAFKIFKINDTRINVVFILGFVSIISVGWEIFEYISSILFNVDPQKVEQTGVADTMKDLIVALFGGIIVLFAKEKVIIDN